MNEQQKHIWQAISLNTLLLLMAGGIIWMWYSGRIPASKPPTTEQRQEEIAFDYLQTLAAYQQLGRPSALLKNLELAEPGLWVAQFETVVKNDLRHSYLLEIQDSRVIGHDITVMDAEGTLLLFSPEPEEIIGLSEMTVKGKAAPGAGVQAQIVDRRSAEVIQKAASTSHAENGEFFLTLPRLISGEYSLQVTSGANEIVIPIIVRTNIL